MGRRYDTVSFLTDYGLDDEFAGVVRSVVRDIAPHATVVDLTHGIRPFDIRGGSLALARAIPYVAEGVVLAVVDPGVGTARRAIAVEVADGAGVLVGPDNGLLAPAVAIVGGAERVVELTNADYHLATLGSTFAGRDVFGPVAAHLCNGVDLAELGPVDRGRSVDAGHGRPAARGGRRDPRRGAVGRPLRQLRVEHRARRSDGRRGRLVDRRSAASAASPTSPPRSAPSALAQSVSSSIPRACTRWPSTNDRPQPSSG